MISKTVYAIGLILTSCILLGSLIIKNFIKAMPMTVGESGLLVLGTVFLITAIFVTTNSAAILQKPAIVLSLLIWLACIAVLFLGGGGLISLVPVPFVIAGVVYLFSYSG